MFIFKLRIEQFFIILLTLLKKTRLRSTMTQTRSHYLVILNIHKDGTHKLNIIGNFPLVPRASFFKRTAWRAPLKVNSFKDESCIARVYYCFHTYPYRNLQQIPLKILNLICLHFGKLQSNTFNGRIPKISMD